MVKVVFRLFNLSSSQAGPTTLFKFARSAVRPSTPRISPPSIHPLHSKVQVRYCSFERQANMSADRDVLPSQYVYQEPFWTPSSWPSLSIKPLNYDLSLSNLQFSGDWKYDGLVKVAAKVQQGTDEVVVNVKDIKITGASAGKGIVFPNSPAYMINTSQQL